ncbi:unnamed protein product [Adineta steineri]|uniref:DUF155 domain-containing protein n=1 Tax=Adineta steineri TaxID=433720 RepID=A0A818WPC1_9BILA|nr:unnamed protein product [Adineta steineri]CAF3728837.1 unnamed protein product [Adineta steineri]
MFSRIIHSLDKTIKCFRYVSQTLPNPIQSRLSSVARPLKCSPKEPILLAGDVTSSMKLSVLKRVPRKKPKWKATNILNQREEQYYNVCALATADWYDLDRLKQRLITLSNSFQLIPISDTINDVLCLQIRTESKTKSEAFIFDDVSENQYPKDLIDNEKEIMNFTEVNTTSSLSNDIIKLNHQNETEHLLDKYTFSNALALSVKLGIWEAVLDDEVEYVADLANRLKQGKHIKIKHGSMQRKSGELYSLKHAVHLSHDFLDTPDFYWSNSRLENLYKKVFNYFTIAKRTKVLNERLNFSLELISVIEASLNEKKHVRLEWIIIILICAEVFFNVIDHLDFFSPNFTPKHQKFSDNRV